MSEVEETLRRIQSHKGVKGVLIVSANGTPIRKIRSVCVRAGPGAVFEQTVDLEGGSCLCRRGGGAFSKLSRFARGAGSNLENDETNTYAALLSQLAMKVLFAPCFFLPVSKRVSSSARRAKGGARCACETGTSTQASSVIRTLDETDELTFFRIRQRPTTVSIYVSLLTRISVSFPVSHLDHRWCF